jgi:hypothetical protein
MTFDIPPASTKVIVSTGDAGLFSGHANIQTEVRAQSEKRKLVERIDQIDSPDVGDERPSGCAVCSYMQSLIV